MPPYVAVVGPGTDVAEPLLAAAREAGSLLAARGAVVLTGGLGGVMAAAAQGAASAGGVAVGLLPGDDRSAGSAGHALLLPTGLGEGRNVLLVRTADAVLAIGGSWGTLAEVALARRMGRPVVGVAGWVVHDAAGSPVDLPAPATVPEAVDLLWRTITHGM